MQKESNKTNDDAEFRGHLATLRQNGTLCDAFISIPGETTRLSVHRVIMASCSDFFRSLFTSGLRETVEPDVKIHGLTLKTMELILQYAYTKQVTLTPDNIEEVFEAADRFSILGLLDDCIQFLSSELSSENCIGILRFAKFFNNVTLKNICWTFLLRNFKAIIRCQEFIQLQADEFLEIISDDRLDVSSEDDVLSAVLNWVEFSAKERRRHYPSLLGAVRLPLVSEYFVKKLVKGGFKQNNTHCWDLINRSRHLQTMYPRHDGCCKSVMHVKPRIPNQVIFIIGGWSTAGVTSSVETYDRMTNMWFEIKDCELPAPRAYHAAIPLSGYIYVVGGFDGVHYLNSAVCLNPCRKTWEERAPMYMSRCYVSAAEIDGVIYACGGFDGRQRHRSAEKYNRQTNQWTLISPMYFNRSDAGVSVLDGKLYVAGGFDGQSCLFSVEMYEPKTDQWTVLTSMVNRRSGVSMVTCRQKLYAIGGYDGMNRLRSVEFYDPTRRAWFTAPSMHLGRSNFSATVMDDVIYVMGGYDGDETSPKVEKYDADEKTWTPLLELNIGRSAVSACVMHDISNSRDFTYHGNQRQTCSAHNCNADSTMPFGDYVYHRRKRKTTSAEQRT